MKTIIEFNYQTIVNRGLINRSTSEDDFILKLKEEVEEFVNASKNNVGNFNEELADIILVCLNISKHYGIDIEKELINKILKNSTR